MVDLIIHDKAIKEGFDYITIDLNENDLEYNPAALKHRFLGKETIYDSFTWKIEGVEFYTIIKDKIVLKTVKVN